MRPWASTVFPSDRTTVVVDRLKTYPNPRPHSGWILTSTWTRLIASRRKEKKKKGIEYYDSQLTGKLIKQGQEGKFVSLVHQRDLGPSASPRHLLQSQSGVKSSKASAQHANTLRLVCSSACSIGRIKNMRRLS